MMSVVATGTYMYVTHSDLHVLVAYNHCRSTCTQIDTRVRGANEVAGA